MGTSTEPDPVCELAAQIADGAEPDWSEALEGASDPAERKVIESLKVIGALARAGRETSPDPSLPGGLPDAPVAPHVPDQGPALHPGQRLGHYEILSKIGAGGMGEVYRARQTQLGREVAIKTLPWRAQMSLAARRRFEREAKLSASLVHRNVVAVHDFCDVNGIAFVVEELLDGASWRSVIRDHPGAAPPFAERMIADAAAGVAAGHAIGLIHRDLKPDNLFEARTGETKVLDFGLARLLDALPVSPVGAAPSSGLGFGTPTYTAPECLRGEPADRRSDVFALSCSAYELLAGVSPFGRTNTGDTIVALLKEDPEPLAGKVAGLSAEFTAVIERGLSKAPEDRPTADEIAQAAMLAARNGRGLLRVLARAKRGVPRRYQVVAAVATAVFLGIALGTYVWLRPVPVAVLLFDATALDKDLAYIGVAISEHLNERLSKAPGVAVVSRLLIAQQPALDPQAAGRALGARRVLSGRLRETSGALRAEVQIIDVPSGRKDWEQAFEGSTADLPGFEDRIMGEAARQLGVSPPERLRVLPASGALDPEAHRLYAEGRYYWYRKTPNELYKSINLFTRALLLQPDYALAHAGLSRAYVDLTFYVHGVSSKETRVVARRAAERSLALDPNLARGVAAMGDVEAAVWNRDLAHRYYERAMQLDPTDPDAYLGEVADVLIPQGRFREAREMLRRGLGLDASSLARESLGRISYYERDFDRALREFSEVLETDPGFVSARYRLGQTLLAKGDPKKALEPLMEADKQTRGLPKGRAIIAVALAKLGRRQEAEAMLAGLLQERDTTYVSATLIAVVYSGLGQADAAFEWLRRGCDEQAEWMHLVGVEPLLDPLRKDPRFGAILKCTGLDHR